MPCKQNHFKKARFLFVLCLILNGGFFSVNAQDEPVNDTVKKWKTGGMGNATFSQIALSNWSSGGENSIALNGRLNTYLNYKSAKASWENTLDLAYGLVQQGIGDKGETRKSDDKIDFSSKIGRKLMNGKWYYSGMLSFKSQMTPGYDYPNDSVKISDFLAPAYVLLSVGFDYQPNDDFSLMISPATGKMTIVKSDFLSQQGVFGVKNGRHSRIEMGGYVKARIKKNFNEKILLESKVDVFSNYIENPENLDFSWELMLNFKFNEYISADLHTNLVYDHDVEIDGVNSKLQFKEVFGIGLSYQY